MRNFIVHNADGRILRVGHAPANMVQVQAMGGEFVLEGECDPSTSYVDSGVVVQMPARPGDNFSFDYASKSWVAVTKSTSEVIDEFRTKRSQLLADSDWTQLPDVPLVTKEAWTSYRQALRDITAQPGFPLNIVWPTPPV